MDKGIEDAEVTRCHYCLAVIVHLQKSFYLYGLGCKVYLLYCEL